MKYLLYLPLIALIGTAPISMAAEKKKDAKQCKDCGCSGPEKGSCPSEKGKKCTCPKS